MKKNITILIILSILLFSFIGCGNQEGQNISGLKSTLNGAGHQLQAGINSKTSVPDSAPGSTSIEPTTTLTMSENAVGNETGKGSHGFTASEELGGFVPVRLVKKDGTPVYCYLNCSELIEYLKSPISIKYLDYDTVLSNVSRPIGRDFMSSRPFFKNGLAAVRIFPDIDVVSKGENSSNEESTDSHSDSEFETSDDYSGSELEIEDYHSRGDVYTDDSSAVAEVLIDKEGDIVSRENYSAFEDWNEQYVIGVRDDSGQICYDLISGSGEVVKTFYRIEDIEREEESKFGKHMKEEGTSFHRDSLDNEMKKKYLYTKYLGNSYHYGGLFNPKLGSALADYLKYIAIEDSDFEGGIRKAVIKDGEQIGGFDYFSLTHVKDDLFYVGDGTQNYFYDFKLNSAVHQKEDLGVLTDFDVYQDLIVCTNMSQVQVFVMPDHVFYNYSVIQCQKSSRRIYLYGINRKSDVLHGHPRIGT